MVSVRQTWWVLWASVGIWSAAAQDTRPNILVLLADDLAPDGIRAWGNREVHTPNLDRLVERGLSFVQAYIQGSWTPAVCIASRAMLMSGQPLWRAQAEVRTRARSQTTWPQLLRAAGYFTAATGKWHVPGAQPEQLFETTVRITAGMPRDERHWYGRPVEGQPDPFCPWDPTAGGYWQGGRHWSEVQADDAIELIRTASTGSRPWFLYIAFNAPHDPRQSPKEFVDLYPPDQLQLPSNFRPSHDPDDAIGLGPKLRDEQLAPFPRTPYAIRHHRREYYAIISHLDAQIGRILAALDATRPTRPTWIFFSSDNGLAVGRHGLMGKQNMYQHSIRVPMVVVGPGVPSNRVCRAPVYMQDLTATILELAGVGVPRDWYWQSLTPFFRDPDRRGRDALYGAYLTFQRMVTDGTWKLVLYPPVRQARLFNLAEDPDELHDRSDDPVARLHGQRLVRRLLELQKETGDDLDLTRAVPEWLNAND
jgi:choline-sulfatase